MGRTLYFDCFAGASGDMILGALLDLGLDFDALRSELAKLPLRGYELRRSEVRRAHLRGTKFDVWIEGEDHAHAHGAGHPHRRLEEIVQIIRASELSERVKRRAEEVFHRLAQAEARAHGCAVEEVTFHEVGAVDSIVDIVGACVGFELLGIERFLASPVHLGRGFLGCAHGRYPVPVPATAELLKGARVYTSDIEAELVTPTGAALLATFCEDFGPMPEMRLEGIGYGAGTRDFPDFPNLLRVMLGETRAASGRERLLMLETNLDDASPQILGHVVERALQAGALEAFAVPVVMKKGRLGTLLTLLCRPEDREALLTLLFRETPTLGVRFYEVERRALAREVVSVETPYGPIPVKVATLDGEIVNAAPEFDVCRQAAERHRVPVREVMLAALVAFRRRDREG
ncbi:MAG: nickel pincer cofactor biosynthesis protein LarC [Blastocatellia bacterium]|nr:nickel pincer cofactor biosynthesis protein LarC [Blastocatellia bacterium]MCS7156698.1 nickel pincer cofactor biosynthesis protein LarC [Blastocatellia bacterium]MCX7751560.1 nickel pincer cofactor biosynthesis protein LarC [Blastocatellia bacterium]MDW8168660.1 nickel pincer cofactor biosynthesis protein LarC [Acidobacteriota bacterium]MDW8256555.1 nickel pincer cofactor biosynthesis protein LarC [Acidobacteriota bacterium]